MGLEAPRLDDRSYNDLVEEALRRIPLYTPEWTDQTPSDPGVTLIELFAWMTDIVLYRLNRVPDKHYIKFMELVGMRLREAAAASAPVTFFLTAPQPIPINIYAGTEIATTRTENEPAIVFTTDVDATINVPTLKFVMTSQKQSAERRTFNEYNLNRIETGLDEFDVFVSEPPQNEEALYLGFEFDLSNHLLGLEFEVNASAGAGIEVSNPPYVWEALSSDLDQDWTKAHVEHDGTRGFNNNGLVRLLVPAMQKATRNQRSAFWLRCRMLSPEEGGGPRYDVAPKFKRLKTASWGITIDASNVSSIRNEVLGRSDGSPGQRFYLAHTPVAPRQPGENLVVRYDNGEEERWTEVSDFASSNPDDMHYTIDSMSGEVRLAPAFPQQDGSVRSYGMVVPKNAMFIMQAYRYGGGKEGNVAEKALNVLKTSIAYIEQVENRVKAQGGLDAENLEDLKLRVPGHLRSLGRAVTASDYEYLAYEAARGQVGRVHCMQSADTAPGEVRLLVLPQVPNLQGFIAPSSLRLQEEVREQIATYLDERRLLSTRLVVREPEIYWVQIEVRFHPALGSDAESVRRAISSTLFDYINPLIGGEKGTGWSFGRGLYSTDLIALLLTIPGVEFIRSVKIFPATFSDPDFIRGNEIQEVIIPPDGVIASYEHIILVE